MSTSGADIVQLRSLVREKGLLSPQPFYNTCQILTTVFLFAGSLLLLVSLGVHNIWLLILSAALMAFASGQMGFIGHNTNHGQLYRNHCWQRSIIESAIALILCNSPHWWANKHTKGHHSSPNQPGKDPDILKRFLRFSSNNTWRIARFIERNQGYLYLPAFFLEGLAIRYSSFKYLITRKNEVEATYRILELSLMAIHIGVYVGGLFFFLDLSFWEALLFTAVHQLLFGLYMALVFAPNHKGMPELNMGNRKPNYIYVQVVTARNVTSSIGPDWLLNWLCGGLNYQCEHHLFPEMCPNKFREAQIIVEQFCEGRVPYKSMTIRESFREILDHLGQIGSRPFAQEVASTS